MLTDGTITVRIRSGLSWTARARRSKSFATAASAARPSYASIAGVRHPGSSNRGLRNKKAVQRKGEDDA
jgi:hypothetical protein